MRGPLLLADTAFGIVTRARMGDKAKSQPKASDQMSAHKFGHADFVHLRVRSCYSLLEGAVRPKELAGLAREMRMPAVAVTDTNNLFGVFEISETLAKAGVQPIIGVTLSVDLDAAAPATGHTQVRDNYPSVAILVKDEAGYINLSKLLSSAYLDVGAGELPHATVEKLAALSGGLILLTGGPNGPIDRLIAAYNPDEGRAICVPTYKAKRGNPVLWSKRFLAMIAAIAGDTGARALLGEYADEVCEVEMSDSGVLLDIDTPEALAELRNAERQASA